MDAKERKEIEAYNTRVRKLILGLGVVVADTKLVYVGGKPGFFGLGDNLIQPIIDAINSIEEEAANHLFSHIIQDSFVNNTKLFSEWINSDVHKQCRNLEALKKSGVLELTGMGTVRASLLIWPFANGLEFFLPRYLSIFSVGSRKSLESLTHGDKDNKLTNAILSSRLRNTGKDDTLLDLLVEALQ